jgi:hypothetical protein
MGVVAAVQAATTAEAVTIATRWRIDIPAASKFADVNRMIAADGMDDRRS